MPHMVIVPWLLESAVPCHTHHCTNRITWKLVPDELVDVAAAAVAGLCDECKASLVAGALDQPVQLTVGWPEVDQFLREHQGDPLTVPIVESALGVFLHPPAKADPPRRVPKKKAAARR